MTFRYCGGSCLRAVVCAVIACQGTAQTLKFSDEEKSVIQVVVRDEQGTFTSQGTAFFIRDDGVMATALHVYVSAVKAISDSRGGAIAARRFARKSGKYSWALVSLVAVDPKHDLALLRQNDQGKLSIWADVGGIRPIALTTEVELAPAESVKVLGYFGEDAFPVSLGGHIAGASIMKPQPTVSVEELLVAVPIAPGFSGGPVLRSDGSAVGLMAAIVPVKFAFNSQPVPSGLGRVVKAEHIKRLLESLKK